MIVKVIYHVNIQCCVSDQGNVTHVSIYNWYNCEISENN